MDAPDIREYCYGDPEFSPSFLMAVWMKTYLEPAQYDQVHVMLNDLRRDGVKKVSTEQMYILIDLVRALYLYARAPHLTSDPLPRILDECSLRGAHLEQGFADSTARVGVGVAVYDRLELKVLIGRQGCRLMPWRHLSLQCAVLYSARLPLGHLTRTTPAPLIAFMQPPHGSSVRYRCAPLARRPARSRQFSSAWIAMHAPGPVS